jgi:hypothetical protein
MFIANGYTFMQHRFEIEEVLPYHTRRRKKREYWGIKVNMMSHRYWTFKEKGCTCVMCGRKGTHFRLQRNSTPQYHFGLWSDDNVQMTKRSYQTKVKGWRRSH